MPEETIDRKRPRSPLNPFRTRSWARAHSSLWFAGRHKSQVANVNVPLTGLRITNVPDRTCAALILTNNISPADVPLHSTIDGQPSPFSLCGPVTRMALQGDAAPSPRKAMSVKEIRVDRVPQATKLAAIEDEC